MLFISLGISQRDYFMARKRLIVFQFTCDPCHDASKEKEMNVDVADDEEDKDATTTDADSSSDSCLHSTLLDVIYTFFSKFIKINVFFL